MSRPINNAISKLSYTAEAIFASLVEAGHDASNLKTYNKGGFKKGYSNDVDSVLIEEHDNNLTFEISLNRDSIYDRLPEGLFHQTKGSSRVNSVTEAVEEHKQFKEEEKQARKFFTPLEQLLFQYKAAAETAERDILYDLQNGKLNSSFYKFWNISTGLPETNAGKLLQLMPYCDSIKGNMAATESALRNVLNRKISVESVQSIDKSFFDQKTLNQQRLGIDAIAGNRSFELSTCWKCTIYDIPDTELVLYIDQAPMKNMIDRFVEIFVPLDVDIIFDFIPIASPVKETHEDILGIGTYL